MYFHTLVLDSFNLDPTQGANIFMFDQLNRAIPVELFDTIINQFKNDSNFYIKIRLASDEQTSFQLV